MYKFDEFVNGKSYSIFNKTLDYLSRWLADTSDKPFKENLDFSDTSDYTSEAAKVVARSFFERKPDQFCEFISKYGDCEWTSDGKGGSFGWVVFLNQRFCAKFTFDHEEHYYANMLKGQSTMVPVVDTYQGVAEMYNRNIYVLAMNRMKDLNRELFEAIADNRTGYWLRQFFLETDKYKQFWQDNPSRAKSFRWPVFCQFTQTFAGVVHHTKGIDVNESGIKEIFELMARVAIRFNIVFLGDFATRNIMANQENKPIHIDLQYPKQLKRQS
jgi:hypothetical protein